MNRSNKALLIFLVVLLPSICAESVYAAQIAHWGVIDTSGKFVVPPHYGNSADAFNALNQADLSTNDAVSTVPDELNADVLKRLERIHDFVLDSVEQDSDGMLRFRSKSRNRLKFPRHRLGFADKNGKLVRWMMPACYALGEFHEGIAPFWIAPPHRQASEIGYVNNLGKVVIAPHIIFESESLILDQSSATPEMPFFSNGLMPLPCGDAVFGRIGYANKEGQIRIPPRFVDAQPFENGYAAVAIGREEFVGAKWKDHEAPSQQLDFFVASYPVIGMTKEEVRLLLGPADQSEPDGRTVTYRAPNTTHYWCGTAFRSYDLVLRFDRNRVAAYRLGSGRWNTRNQLSKNRGWVQQVNAKELKPFGW